MFFQTLKKLPFSYSEIIIEGTTNNKDVVLDCTTFIG